MSTPPPVRRVRGIAALVTLVAFLAGCTSWAPLESPYEQAIADRQPHQVDVTRHDSSTVRLYGPVITADSLVGLTVQSPPGGRLAIPLSNIDQITYPHTDGLKTGLLIGGIVVLIFGVAAIAYASSNWGLGSVNLFGSN